jgi:hypothetical protein
MLRKTVVAGVKVKRGERMATGKGWRLVGPGKKAFKASLLKRLDIGGESIAIFRVLRHPDSK